MPQQTTLRNVSLFYSALLIEQYVYEKVKEHCHNRLDKHCRRYFHKGEFDRIVHRLFRKRIQGKNVISRYPKGILKNECPLTVAAYVDINVRKLSVTNRTCSSI